MGKETPSKDLEKAFESLQDVAKTLESLAEQLPKNEGKLTWAQLANLGSTLSRASNVLREVRQEPAMKDGRDLEPGEAQRHGALFYEIAYNLGLICGAVVAQLRGASGLRGT